MKVALQPYATEWPVLFEYEKCLLENALDIENLIIEHIGSTAVPGLSAKPIIDIMVGIPEDIPLDRVENSLINVGYVYIKYYERFIPHRKFFIRIKQEEELSQKIINSAEDLLNKEGFEHTHHLHVVHYDNQFWKDHLKFRDHLRANAADRLVYELLKKQLTDLDWENVNDYAKAKTNFIQMILDRV